MTGHTADTVTAEPVSAALEFQDAVADHHKQAMRLHAASIPAGPGSEAVDSFAQLETIGEVVFPLERASHSGAAHHDRMFMWAHALLAAADERQRPPGTVAGEFKNALTRLTPATAMYVTTDDLLAAHPEPVPPRPRVAIAPKITDAELLTLNC